MEIHTSRLTFDRNRPIDSNGLKIGLFEMSPKDIPAIVHRIYKARSLLESPDLSYSNQEILKDIPHEYHKYLVKEPEPDPLEKNIIFATSYNFLRVLDGCATLRYSN